MPAADALHVFDAMPKVSADAHLSTPTPFSAELDHLYGAKFERASLTSFPKTTDELSMLEGAAAVEYAVEKILHDLSDNTIDSAQMEYLTRHVIGSYGDVGLGIMSLQIASAERLERAKSPWTVDLSYDKPNETVGMRWTHRDPNVLGADLRFKTHETDA